MDGLSWALAAGVERAGGRGREIGLKNDLNFNWIRGMGWLEVGNCLVLGLGSVVRNCESSGTRNNEYAISRVPSVD